MELYNKISRSQALKNLEMEKFKRVTISFYKYTTISNPQLFRDALYKQWGEFSCFGRIYIAQEGINAQLSIPLENYERFASSLEKHSELKGVKLNRAFKDDGKSFYKLIIKVRPQIVADHLNHKSYDLNNPGIHLSPNEFHELAENEENLIIDMRNHYESEIGKFKRAYCPDADTFHEAIEIVEKKFENEKDKKILLYCTGGIRCEKASAYLKSQGFKDVNQLQGGVISYGHYVKENGLQSNFTGKNFVFDERMGESIDGKVISTCHQCGDACDYHVNCSNDDCHLLFIQCSKCAVKCDNCCSPLCREIVKNSQGDKNIINRSIEDEKKEAGTVFKSRLRPKLRDLNWSQSSYA